MFSFLSLIFGFLSGLAGPIAAVLNKITDLKIARAKADSETTKAEINLELEIAVARKAVLLAEAGDKLTRRINGFVRLVAASGPIAYLTKIFLWDKTIGAFYGCSGVSGDMNVDCHIFNTDPLADINLWWVVISVIGFYFIATTWRRK